MSRLLADTPFVEAYLRAEFCYDQRSGHGEFYPAYIFGFCARPGRVPAFQVMLHCGAQWAEVPLHMLTLKECAPALAPETVCWWDCFSHEFEVVELAMLKNLRCEMRDRYGRTHRGNYLFTVAWQGLWAEIPDQHKNHHIIVGEEGQIFAYPNNKIRWLDASYVKGDMPEEVRHWRPNSQKWSVEE